MSTDHNFWRERRAEEDSNRGPSAVYLPNALPLSQTGSHAFWQSTPGFNLFTALACKISGLKDARTRQQTVYFPVL